VTGRVYSWRGQRWRVLARWGRPSVGSPATFACPTCGSWGLSPEGAHVGRLMYLCGWCRERGREVFMRRAGGPPRNVLLERVEARAVTVAPGCDDWLGTGELVVRPFRGLRKVTS
jgi:hypothetical protein